MITRIAATSKVSLETPTCNRSKSRATMQQHTKIITNSTTTSIPAGQLITMPHTKTNRTATTMRRFCLAVLQVLVLACALPPPLQPLLPVALLPPRWSFVVEALPITSKPIEGTAENLAWQAWLMLPPEQKQLEKSRKVTPKSIFSLPFRDCPPGHQLFQSRCIPTVNINQSDLLTQQVLGLFVGNEGTASSDNAYEFDYEDEEYGLGYGEGEPAVMYESAQSFNAGSAAGSGNAQQPPARDEPLKFNLFQQKYPTNDYEADVSSGAVEGSGGARPLNEMLPANMSEGDRIGGVASNDNYAGTPFFNTTQLLDAVQGFFQRHSATSSGISSANTTTANANTADNNNRFTNANSTNSHRVSDLHAASSNISAFAVGDIDAIILSAASSGISATTVRSSGGGVGGSAVGGDLEPHRISLFKDDSSVQLVTTVIAHSNNSNHTSNEGAMRAKDGDLVAAAQQQQNSFAQFLRADALLPLSSVAPYITTTTTSTSTFRADAAGYATKTPPPATKDERPRSVMQHNSAEAATNTDAQELSFTTTTEAEGTTSFQIDDTTVVEENAEFANAPEGTSLLEAISKQQQLEFQKSKVEPVEDLAPITATTLNEETTTAGDSTTTTETTKTIVNETDETTTTTTTTTKQALEVSEKSVETTTRADTTTQPLPNAAALPSKIVATTTAKTILTTTPNTNRLRSTPVAAVTPIQVAAGKQVSAAVNSVAPQAANIIAGEETATSSTDIVSDVPRSGNGDLVNVVAASSGINSDTNNDNNKNNNNKESPTRSKTAEAAAATSVINIQQELRMINELVKGNRQLAATKMPTIKTTASIATATSTLPTAIEPKLDLKKSANVVENEQNVSRAETAGEGEVEERRDVDAATKTQLAAITAEDKMLDKVSVSVTGGNEDEGLQTTTGAGGTTTAAPQAQTATKMESGSTLTEATTVENIKTAAALGEIIELATTTSAQPYFETETEATAASTEATGGTLWSRIMPLFGFGAIPPAVEDEAKDEAEAETEATAATTTTIATTPEEFSGSSSFGSISSNSSDSTQNSHSSSSVSSSSTLSDISSVSENVNNNNIISNNNNFVSHSRRNSKIIRIDQLSDDSVPAATTNTLEDTAATNMYTTTTTATAEAEQSTYWWLPTGWRTNRDANKEQSLLFRLWSAFPESQMKAKVRT
ncbi:protein folded gastrulation [Anastrepha obliqua]|uniref:protein folded gastrulation n=1 Tax=Anastrepha obliqua TaxID=95512 RepID=UPI002409ED05|nr:protein folded gastrulation [Anastrepha obliqua]